MSFICQGCKQPCQGKPTKRVVKTRNKDYFATRANIDTGKKERVKIASGTEIVEEVNLGKCCS